MKEIAVIGAGIVGLATALQLTLDGYRVRVFEPNGPASGCSSGNGGYLSLANVFPPSSMEALWKLPRLLLDPDGPLVVRPGYLPRFIPWGWQAAVASRGARLRAAVDAMSRLILNAIDSYEPLLEAASARHLIDHRGALVVARTQSGLAARSARNATLQRYGVEVRMLNGQEVRELEPALAADVVGGIFFPGAARCVNPQTLGETFAASLAERGAVFIKDSVKALAPGADGGWTLHADGGSYATPRVVVCAGRWSDDLLAPLGYRVPLEAERGYHLMLPDAGVALNRPVSMAEGYFVATPMSHGLRLAGTAEFAGTSHPMNPARAHKLADLARPYLPGLSEQGAVPWMGVRPSLPDGLPAIGRAARHRDLFYCFGHNHNGLMQAAISARLLSGIVGDAAAPFDLSPYSLDRFQGLASRFGFSPLHA